MNSDEKYQHEIRGQVALLEYLIIVANMTSGTEVWRALFAEMRYSKQQILSHEQTSSDDVEKAVKAERDRCLRIVKPFMNLTFSNSVRDIAEMIATRIEKGISISP